MSGIPRMARLSEMEVESTHVQVLPDGKKMIDVRIQRNNRAIVEPESRLIVPHFDAESSSSSSDEEDTPPVFPSSPQKASIPEQESNNHEYDPYIESQEPKLMEQLIAYKHQVKNLEIQLEALTPLPGLSTHAVHEILDGNEHDLRDSKIVHQAKTLRHLKRSLQREKQCASDAVKQSKQLLSEKTALEQENETLKLQVARYKARASAVAIPPSGLQEPENDTPTVSKESVQYRKKYEDLKIKHDKLAMDLKKTQRVLIREVGEDVNIDELIESNSNDGKRLRAQQIITLKAKIKKLEQEIKGTNGSESNPIDQRVQNDLTAQHEQKQRVIDRLSSEREELMERIQHMNKKHEGLKSRTQILEKENKENKSKITLLVDKSRNDDALIDALQKQMETWKNKVNEVKRARTADTNGLGKDERMELDRLRAMIAEYKRNPSTPMANVSEIAQYRALATEKERLAELVKTPQVQVEDKDRQLKSFATEPPVSRIPRLGQSTKSNYIPNPPEVVNNEMATLRKTFRDTIASKDQEIEALQQQLQHIHVTNSPSQDTIQDLQDENTYLRQEFDKLKTRYESLVKQQRTKPL